jgi:hypothetical protein
MGRHRQDGTAKRTIRSEDKPQLRECRQYRKLLNEVLTKRQCLSPSLVQTEDSMRIWEANTPREYVLRLYKFLNAVGYTVIGIDAAIEREVQKRKAPAVDVSISAKKGRP